MSKDFKPRKLFLQTSRGYRRCQQPTMFFVNLSDSNQNNLFAIQALARLSDNKASYRNFITLALGKHLVDNAPSVGVLRCSKIQQMLGIKIFARGRIYTVWPVPHYAGAAGAILVAQKHNYTKLISCLLYDVYAQNFLRVTHFWIVLFPIFGLCNFFSLTEFQEGSKRRREQVQVLASKALARHSDFRGLQRMFLTLASTGREFANIWLIIHHLLAF